jgi:hypothetical protein
MPKKKKTTRKAKVRKTVRPKKSGGKPALRNLKSRRSAPKRIAPSGAMAAMDGDGSMDPPPSDDGGDGDDTQNAP